MTEGSAVQNPILQHAAAIGWEYVPAADALQWRAWGPKVHLVQGKPLWPSRQQVADAVHVALLAVRR